MAKILNKNPYGIEEWEEAIKEAGQYLIDNAHNLIREVPRTRGITVTASFYADSIPTIKVERELNYLSFERDKGVSE